MGSGFERWVRTGARPLSARIEVKFNPWHDPANGRFTFAGGGTFYGRDGAFGGAGATGRFNDGYGQPTDKFGPRNPSNRSIYVVRKGDSLTRVAAQRRGLRVSDLAGLNGLAPIARLRIGQKLLLPNQSYLDAGKQARANYVNLNLYMDTHGGRLPPNPAKAPTVDEQLNSDFRKIVRGRYAYDLDILARTRKASGTLFLAPPPVQRSRSNQANAGKPDRLQTDDGGHFIAARFGGPREALNHFAQDATLIAAHIVRWKIAGRRR